MGSRVCFEYRQDSDSFVELEDCRRETPHTETYEDIDLYGLYKDLRKHFEELSLSGTERKGEYIRIETEQKGKINPNIPLNLLLKGVPGTLKSSLLDRIIEEDLEIKNKPENILRINIHSAITNAELMQGIGISTTEEGNILYLEKEGLILNHIKKAIMYPHQPFVLILEEVQENSLNELIGDLIYLIDEDKRTDLIDVLKKAKNKGISLDNQIFSDIAELVKFLIKKDLIDRKQYVEIPYLVENKTEYRPLIFPKNLYIFCTSNYREDKKIMEDNLLRRFSVVELYPDENGVPEKIRSFFKSLNDSILKEMEEEIHPDRYLIGHAIFLNVKDKKSFAEALIKVLVEFKDLKEIEFDVVKRILEQPLKLLLEQNDSQWLSGDEINKLLNANNYKEMFDILQRIAFENLINRWQELNKELINRWQELKNTS